MSVHYNSKKRENRDNLTQMQLAARERRQREEREVRAARAMEMLEKANPMLVLRRPAGGDMRALDNWANECADLIRAANRSGKKFHWNPDWTVVDAFVITSAAPKVA